MQGYLSTLKAKNDMISKLLEEVGKGRTHNPTTVCTNCLPWSKNYHNLCAKYENSQSKIAMLEIKAKSVSTNKVDKETNTVETGSTAQIGSKYDHKQRIASHEKKFMIIFPEKSQTRTIFPHISTKNGISQKSQKNE